MKNMSRRSWLIFFICCDFCLQEETHRVFDIFSQILYLVKNLSGRHPSGKASPLPSLWRDFTPVKARNPLATADTISNSGWGRSSMTSIVSYKLYFSNRHLAYLNLFLRRWNRYYFIRRNRCSTGIRRISVDARRVSIYNIENVDKI